VESNKTKLTPQTFIGSIILTDLVAGGVVYAMVASDEETVKPQAQRDITEEYISAGYRVLAVRDNPAGYDTIIVATERAKDDCGAPDHPQRCMNDTLCGSLYSQPTCYFFLEPQYHYVANPKTRFIAKLERKGALQIDTIKFKGEDKATFETVEGDAGWHMRALWTLDLKSGEITLDTKEQSYAEPDP